MKKVIPFLALTLAVAASLVPLATGAPAATQTVRVNATSYKISLSARPKAGTVRFVVRNVGDRSVDQIGIDPRQRPGVVAAVLHLAA